MIYYKSSELTLLNVNDIVAFRVKTISTNILSSSSYAYKIRDYVDGFYLEHNYCDNISTSILLHLKIINPKTFVRKFNCKLYGVTISGNLTSNNLIDLTKIIKELMILNERMNNKFYI